MRALATLFLAIYPLINLPITSAFNPSLRPRPPFTPRNPTKTTTITTTTTSLASSSAQGNEDDIAKRISYASHLQNRKAMKYQLICAPAFEPLALRLQHQYPQRFTYHPTSYNKFPDGTDDITISGFTPYNLISGEHVLFLASFDDNDTTLSQFQVMIVLLQSFVRRWVQGGDHGEWH